MARRFSPSALFRPLSIQARALFHRVRPAAPGSVSEALIYQGLLDHNPDGIIILTLDDRILKINAQAASLLGYSPDELLGRSIWDAGLSAEPEQGRAIAALLHAGESVPTYERQLRRKDGSVLTGELTVTLIRDAEGRPSHVQFVLHDISARKQTETALADQNRLLQTLIDTIPDFVYVKDASSRFLISNPPHASSMGTTSEQVGGKTDFDFFPQELALRYFADEQEIIHSGQALHSHEEPSISHDGKPIWALTSKVPLRDSSGNTVGLVGITRDITRIKEREERLVENERFIQKIAQTVPDILYVFDFQENRYIYTNQEMITQILGYSSGEIQSLNMQTMQSLLHPDDVATMARWAERFQAARDDEIVEAEYRLRHSDGSWRWLLSRDRVFARDGQGRPTRSLGVAQDITERKRAEQQVQQQNEYLMALHEITPALMNRLEPVELLRTVLNRAVALLGTADGYIDLVVPGADTLYEFASTGTYEGYSYQAKPGEGMSGWVWQNGETLVVDDYATWPHRLDNDVAATFHASICLPLKSGDEVVGVLGMAYTEPGKTFDDESVELLERIVQLASLALDHARLYTAVQQELAERKRTEEALRQSEERYRAVIEDQTELIVRFLPDTTVTFVNDAYCRFFGKTRDQLIGKSFMWHVPEEDREDHRQYMIRLSTEKSVMTAEHRVQLESGEIRWLQWSDRAVFNAAGEAVEFQTVARDITDRRQAEEALRVSLEEQKQTEAALEKERTLLRTLIDALPDHIYVKDRDSRFVTANLVTARAYRFESPDELIGKSDLDLFPGAVGERYYAMEQAMMSRGESIINFENAVTDREGNPAWRLVSKVPLRDADGNIIGLVGITRDITELKRAELALQEERTLLRTLFDALPDHIFVKDRDSRFVTANLVTAKAYRFQTLDELIGKSDLDLFPTERAQRYYAMEQQMMNRGESILNYENPTIDPDGNPMWTLISKVPLRNADGDIIGLVGVSRNITEQKKTQQALQAERDFVSAILTSLVTLITVQDTEGRLISFNRACEELTGYTFEEVAGKPFWDLFVVPEEMDAVRQMFKITLDGDFPNTNINYWRMKDGSRRLIEWSNTVLTDADGKATHMISTGIDITVRKELEEQSVELAVEREKVKILGNFIRDASHDFRTPLSILNTNLYLIRRTLNNPDLDPRITEMERQVHHLTELIEQLLFMTRLDSTPDQKLARLNLNDVVRDLHTRTLTMVERKGLSLVLDFAAEAPWVEADNQNLSQALNNIVANAVRFTPTGGTITVRTVAEGDYAGIEVADTGIGIAEPDLPHIFDRFYRADKARSTVEGGAGLGLAIAKKVIDLHGGTIAVETTPGGGTTFRVLLPAFGARAERLIELSGNR